MAKTPKSKTPNPKSSKPKRPSTLHPLYEFYPESIKAMEEVFTSHEFILYLARNNQKLYIEALNDQRDNKAPFGIVHNQLSTHLHEFPQLVEPLGKVSSEDIFRQPGHCAAWRKKPEGN